MDWRTLIASDPGVPDQEDVLRVIDYHHYDPAKCEKLLQYLNGKKPIRIFRNRFYLAYTGRRYR